MQDFPHLTIPVTCLSVCRFTVAGILDFTKMSLIFLCRLCATNGGSLNTWPRYGSWPIIDRQCFVCRLGMDGRRGSYCTAKTGRFDNLLFITCLSAFFSIN